MFVQQTYEALKRSEAVDKSRWTERGKRIAFAIENGKRFAGGCKIVYERPNVATPTNVGTWTVSRNTRRKQLDTVFTSGECDALFFPLSKLGLSIGNDKLPASRLQISAFTADCAIMFLSVNDRVYFPVIMDSLVAPDVEAPKVAMRVGTLIPRHKPEDLEFLLQHVVFQTTTKVADVVNPRAWLRIRATHMRWSPLRRLFVAVCVVAHN
jgi:hypothetical protein